MKAQPQKYQSSIFSIGPTRADSTFSGAITEYISSGAWIEYVPNWLSGHELLFDALTASIDWHLHSRQMYDRVVQVPRLTGSEPRLGCDREVLVDDIANLLSERYDRNLCAVSFALYRDGRDSVAMHGDKIGRLKNDCVVGIVAVGAPRRFLMREVAGSGARDYALGWGDLFVMGGDCQASWRHGVPKVPRADPRISIMFRQSVAD